MTLRFVLTLPNMPLRAFFKVPRLAIIPTPAIAAMKSVSIAVADELFAAATNSSPPFHFSSFAKLAATIYFCQQDGADTRI